MSEINTEIERLKERINQLITPKDWGQLFAIEEQYRFTYNSNKLEGNSLTFGETINFLTKSIIPKNRPIGHIQDISNHQKVLNLITNSYYHREITEKWIKDIHQHLMKDTIQWDDDGYYSPGQYKQFENFAITQEGKVKSFCKPDRVGVEMVAFIRQLNESVNRMPISELCADTHQCFIGEIHPFAGGNGRVGRILINTILMKQNYTPIPFDIERDTYLAVVSESTKEDYKPLQSLITSQLHHALKQKLYVAENISYKNDNGFSL